MQSNPLLLDFLEGLFYRTSATATSSRDIAETSTKIAVSAKVQRPATLLTQELRCRCFLVNSANFFRIAIL